MYKSVRNELLRDSNIELYTENQELKREIDFLHGEIYDMEQVLDSISDILHTHLDTELAEKIYNEIFEL